eukprot:3563761-Pleurochrysis_carterae.AAC.3
MPLARMPSVLLLCKRSWRCPRCGFSPINKLEGPTVALLAFKVCLPHAGSLSFSTRARSLARSHLLSPSFLWRCRAADWRSRPRAERRTCRVPTRLSRLAGPAAWTCLQPNLSLTLQPDLSRTLQPFLSFTTVKSRACAVSSPLCIPG